MKTSSILLKSLQNLKRLLLRFLLPAKMYILLFPSTARSTNGSPPSNLYHHCSEFSLDAFLDCLLNHNLRRLIRSGTATSEQLAERWEHIYSEWCEHSGSTQYRTVNTLKNDYYAIMSRKESIDNALFVLAYRYSADMVRILKNYGYNYEFNWNDTESYFADLERVRNKAKTLEVTLKIKEAEYRQLQQSLSGKEVTLSDWEDLITAVSRHMNGMYIDKKLITVSEFASYYKSMIRYNEAEQREVERIRHG